jgi:hypothetical protein
LHEARTWQVRHRAAGIDEAQCATVDGECNRARMR